MTQKLIPKFLINERSQAIMALYNEDAELLSYLIDVRIHSTEFDYRTSYYKLQYNCKTPCPKMSVYLKKHKAQEKTLNARTAHTLDRFPQSTFLNALIIGVDNQCVLFYQNQTSKFFSSNLSNYINYIPCLNEFLNLEMQHIIWMALYFGFSLLFIYLLISYLYPIRYNDYIQINK